MSPPLFLMGNYTFKNILTCSHFARNFAYYQCRSYTHSHWYLSCILIVKTGCIMPCLDRFPCTLIPPLIAGGRKLIASNQTQDHYLMSDYCARILDHRHHLLYTCCPLAQARFPQHAPKHINDCRIFGLLYIAIKTNDLSIMLGLSKES